MVPIHIFIILPSDSFVEHADCNHGRHFRQEQRDQAHAATEVTPVIRA